MAFDVNITYRNMSAPVQNKSIVAPAIAEIESFNNQFNELATYVTSLAKDVKISNDLLDKKLHKFETMMTQQAEVQDKLINLLEFKSSKVEEVSKNTAKLCNGISQ
ncbi:MAG: hypothetical protein EOP45_11410 [Sphingobacteriaceae bacterium]|nr:MAG: hypothetical protein EOP45_11410 [Sphingobacteriaceae bacterium]